MKIETFACGWNSYIDGSSDLNCRLSQGDREIYNWGRNCAEQYKKTGAILGLADIYKLYPEPATGAV